MAKVTFDLSSSKDLEKKMNVDVSVLKEIIHDLNKGDHDHLYSGRSSLLKQVCALGKLPGFPAFSIVNFLGPLEPCNS